VRTLCRRVFSALGIALTLSSPSAVALAQDRPAPSPAPDVTYDFGDHSVDGGRYTPDGELVFGRGGRGHATLVRPRVHFVPELLRSVERL
jgi:hypothetical protein